MIFFSSKEIFFQWFLFSKEFSFFSNVFFSFFLISGLVI